MQIPQCLDSVLLIAIIDVEFFSTFKRARHAVPWFHRFIMFVICKTNKNSDNNNYNNKDKARLNGNKQKDRNPLSIEHWALRRQLANSLWNVVNFGTLRNVFSNTQHKQAARLMV